MSKADTKFYRDVCELLERHDVDLSDVRAVRDMLEIAVALEMQKDAGTISDADVKRQREMDAKFIAWAHFERNPL